MTASALSFGGGVNSTAMLLLLCDLGTPPSICLFADTGGERPETYRHIDTMREWCAARGIAWETVSNGSEVKGATLEANCIKRKELPSLAYGFKGCSAKWKRQPMDRFLRTWQPAVDAWARGDLVIRYIGIDAGESHRAKLPPDDRFRYVYPLADHDIDRDGCEALIRRHGLEVPPKSSCFFCPAMKKREVLDLWRMHPDLARRAIAIERNAVTHTVAGLGRSWKWEDLITGRKMTLFPSVDIDAPCGCFDQSEP